MSDVYYAFADRPLSHNQAGSTAEYKQKIADDFRKKFLTNYPFLPFPLTEDLQTDILYLDGTKAKTQVTDIDNISKPLVDALRGVVYIDDSQVVRRVATRFSMCSYSVTTLDFKGIPFSAFNIVDTAIKRKKDQIVIMRIKEIDLNSFGGKFL